MMASRRGWVLLLVVGASPSLGAVRGEGAMTTRRTHLFRRATISQIVYAALESQERQHKEKKSLQIAKSKECGVVGEEEKDDQCFNSRGLDEAQSTEHRENGWMDGWMPSPGDCC
ncbi:hypothetical protein F4778DRAFT_197384 [Xylariomycetidae sp. FL2044]|nr:hypothetical protein F4778DRAFT_197384 [Xylariomycetidae sp. FL2044]